MKRSTSFAGAVVNGRSEASHHTYLHSIGPMFCLLLSVCILLALPPRPAAAQITVGGDPGEVDPADPSTWTWDYSSEGKIGINPGKSGTVTVAGGTSLSNFGANIGYNAGSNGAVSISGAGTTWNNGDLIIGFHGTGTLTVADGATVTTMYHAFIGNRTDSRGTVVITDPSSTWTVQASSHFVVGCTDGLGNTGTLRIENGGVVDGRLSTMSIGWPSSSGISSGTVIVSGPGSSLLTRLALRGGMLRVENGGSFIGGGSIGNGPGCSGTVTITGAGSTWTNDYMYVGGPYATGSLRVENGGKVSTSISGSIGCVVGSSGTATVSGAGSAWTNSGMLCMGYSGTGTGTGVLTVGSAGKVTAKNVSNNSTSALQLHVSGDDMLVLGNAATVGSIANDGKVNLYADAFLTAGTYTPITESQGRTMAWSGTGSYNSFGGTWDDGDKTFTVAAATLLDSGVSADVTTGQRLLITDSATGRRVGASFGGVADGTNFKATLLSGAGLSGIPAAETVLGAWNFTTNFAGDQALLSFDVGTGHSDLAVWHYDDTTWTPFDASDLTYGDDGIASFAVTGFSGYAVTVPEPATMTLLALGGLAILRRRIR